MDYVWRIKDDIDRLFYERPKKLDIKKNIRCGACGSTNTGLVNVKGRSFPFKDLEKVKISVDFYMNGCLECDNVMIKSRDVKHLDQAIRNSIVLLKHMHEVTIIINEFLNKKESLSSLHEGMLLRTSINQDLIPFLLLHKDKVSKMVSLSEEEHNSYKVIRDNLSKILEEAHKIIDYYN